ncbi:hypothetical protein GCM10010399_05290 [Dactylosporangium fulvum]
MAGHLRLREIVVEEARAETCDLAQARVAAGSPGGSTRPGRSTPPDTDSWHRLAPSAHDIQCTLTPLKTARFTDVHDRRPRPCPHTSRQAWSSLVNNAALFGGVGGRSPHWGRAKRARGIHSPAGEACKQTPPRDPERRYRNVYGDVDVSVFDWIPSEYG